MVDIISCMGGSRCGISRGSGEYINRGSGEYVCMYIRG